MFKIEDFISSYPDVNTPNLQTLLTDKRELNELAPPLVEAPPGRCEFYKHQELFSRIFLQYDKILLMDRTGTGKSISMIHASENIHRLVTGVRTAMDSLPQIHRSIFLVKGDILAEEFKQQLVYKGTCEGTYDVEIVLNAKTSSAKRSAITRTIKDWWEVDHFQSFANKLVKMSDEEIIDQYSGSLVFIDEAHYIKNLNVFEASLEGEENKEQKSKFGNIYQQIHRFVHLIRRSKLVLTTATPMINSPNEIIGELNLLNDLDLQISEDQFDWDHVLLEDLYPYIYGKVCYVRELDTGIELLPAGTIPNIKFNITDHKGDTLEIGFQNTIYFTQMSAFQTAGYKAVSGGNYEIKKRNASCFIFPDGSSGGDFPRNMRGRATTKTENGKTRGKKKQTERKEPLVNVPKIAITKYVNSEIEDEFSATKEFSQYLSNFENIIQSSSKYSDILLKYSPTISARYNRKYYPGNVFIYSALKSGSGAFVLSLCLEHHGFERFKDTFTPIDRNTGAIREGISKKLRYALITGETPNPRKDAIKELFNHPMNKHGEYLKIIIGNETTQAGISFSNTINFDLVVADWHSAGIYQALSRILRATSYVNLIAENPGIRLGINIFYHCSLATEGTFIQITDINSYIAKHDFVYDPILRTFSFSNIIFSGVDLDLYVLAEDKNHRNKRIERMLVQSAINAQINYFRNHRTTDKDYTEICYYDICDYKFSDPKSSLGDIIPLIPETQWSNLKDPNLDLSTFEIYYSESLLLEITQRLIRIFRLASLYNIDEILKSSQFSDFPERYLWLTINKIMSEKKIIYNRYGVPCYLYVNANRIWISAEYENEISPFYYEHYVSLSKIPFEEYVNSTDTKQQQIVQKIQTNFNEEQWNNLTLITKVKLFENAYIRYKNGDSNPNIINFIKPFLSTLATFSVNQSLISELSELYNLEISKKNLKFIIPEEYKDALLEENKNNETVTVHWILNRSEHRDNYTTAQRLNQIFPDTELRIYDSSINSWRKTQGIEHIIYSFLIENAIEQKLEPFRNQIYEFIDFDGNPRLIDDRPKEYKVNTSGSHKSRGMSSIPSKESLVEMLTDFGYERINLLPMTAQNLYLMLLVALKERNLVLDYDTLRFNNGL